MKLLTILLPLVLIIGCESPDNYKCEKYTRLVEDYEACLKMDNCVISPPDMDDYFHYQNYQEKYCDTGG